MINAEKFKDELLEILSENRYIEVDKSNRKIRKCTGNNCPKCMFGITALGKGRDSCSIAAMLWLLSEYKETAKLSKLEYEFLKWSEKKGHKYIVRDKINHLFIFKDAPIKRENCWVPESSYCSIALFDNLFKFIKQEDEEPRAIKDILESCEVVNDAEE